MSRATSLLDQVAHEQVLAAAYKDVRGAGGAPGVDGISLEAFAGGLEPNLRQLSRELRGGWYAPLPVRRLFIPKPDGNRRAIGVPAVRDRVVARACQRILTPALDRQFCRGSFAYRKGRSARGAVERVTRFIRSGSAWVALIDIRDFFPSIDRPLMMTFLEEVLHRDPLVPVIAAIMDAGFVDAEQRHGSQGLEQGNPLSPLLANVYLHPWDSALTGRGVRWVRYSDNALIACPDRAQAELELAMAREDLARLRLELNPQKSLVTSSEEGFPFLGYHISTEGIGPELGAIERLRIRLTVLRSQDAGQLAATRIKARRQVLQGWLNYYNTLRGMPMVDGLTLAAALELAANRRDVVGARALLQQEVEGEVDGEGLAAIRRAAAAAGVGESLSGEPVEEPSETAPALPAGLPRNRATRTALPEAGTSLDAAPGTGSSVSSSALPSGGGGDDYHQAEVLIRGRRFREAMARAGIEMLSPRPAPPRAVQLDPAPEAPVAAPPSEAPTPARSQRHEGGVPMPSAGQRHEGDASMPAIIQEMSSRETSPPLEQAPVPEEPPIHVSRAAVAALSRLFRGDSQRHARMWVDSSGRRGYAPIQGPLDEAAWRRHLMGEQTLALPLNDQGRLHVAVIDVDVSRPVFDRVRDDPQGLRLCLQRTHQHALALLGAARARGLDVRLEDSGQKGRHVWLFFVPAASPLQVHRLLRRLIDDAGEPPPGVVCETLPPSSQTPRSSMGALIGLPLGVHLQSGRRSLFLEESGRPVHDVERYLMSIHPCSADMLRQALQESPPPEQVEAPPLELDDGIDLLVQGCPVLARLITKAGAIGHLNHHERMVLLCTLGHFGEAGKAAIHRVIQRCANYDQRITQKHIDRLKPLPVSCNRIREWLPEVVKEVPCCCRFNVPKGAYPSPVLHAVPGAKA